MVYAVVALFDDELSSQIKDIWLALERNNISTYAKAMTNRKPHLTLASYDNITDIDYFVRKLSIFCSKHSVISIQLTTLGTFLSSQALFLEPTMSRALFDIHSKYYQEFSEFSGEYSALYAPDKWIPHTTVANYLTEEKLVQAFMYCQKTLVNLTGKITALSLIEIRGKSIVELNRISLMR